MKIRSSDQVECQLPQGLAGDSSQVGELAPVEMTIVSGSGGRIAGERLEMKFEGIEIVAAESGDEDGAHLIKIDGHSEFSHGSAGGKIIETALPLAAGDGRC